MHIEDFVNKSAKLVSCVDHVALSRVVRKVAYDALDFEEICHHTHAHFSCEVFEVRELMEVVRKLVNSLAVAVDAIMSDR